MDIEIKGKMILIMFATLFTIMVLIGVYFQYNNNIIISIIGILIFTSGFALLTLSFVIYTIFYG